MPRTSAVSREDSLRLAEMYRDGATQAEIYAAFPYMTEGMYRGRITKLQLHRPPHPEHVRGLDNNHPAVLEGRTRFPSRVRRADEAPAVLTPGEWQKKLGKVVEKGAWRGMPIYSLTLEERATCPSDCHHWNTCMGNGMHWSWRNRPGLELEVRLNAELRELNTKHPRGFVVRLHILGDFYSVAYVKRWRNFLERYPALRVFGYTARSMQDRIGRAVHRLATEHWDRFAIRLSTTEVRGPRRAITAWEWPYQPRSGEIVCPIISGRTRDCGTCGLCWNPHAQDKAIVFVAHGR